MAESRLDSILPIPFDGKLLEELVDKSRDWALMHGAAMRSKTQFTKDSLNFAPFTLLPSPFPRVHFHKAVDVQTLLNELMHKVAHDRTFLTECLQDTVKADTFTGNLFKIYETVLKEGVKQPLTLGAFRSDYMTHDGEGNRIKQVEFNTIASSFAGISVRLSSLHRYVLTELGQHTMLANLPENNALQGLCNGILEAWAIYDKKDAIVLFLIEDVTYNICDQRFHEFELKRLNPSVRVVRRTLTEIADAGKLNANNELILDDQLEVAVIYFRAGYEPAHYHGKREWDARLMMERSTAIKCPSIQYHLAGTKKVQQVLAKRDAVARFFTNDDDATKKIDRIVDCFTGLYSLDFDENGERAIRMAIENPEKFVLKPQREGGGNNVYGVEVRDALLSMENQKERTGWILMDRISAPLIRGYIVRPGASGPPSVDDLTSELGVFGVVIGDSEKILVNRQVGHMLRTKSSKANEGGVAAGLGALDSPYLID